MAKCEHCGKKPAFGQSRSKAFNTSKRMFKVNLQTVRVLEKGSFIRKTLCAKCIKTLAKAV
jgi:large subunit ribosomal protein L28